MSTPQPTLSQIELPQIEIDDSDVNTHITVTAGSEPPSPVESQYRERSVSFPSINKDNIPHNASSESLSSMGKSTTTRNSQLMRRKSVYSIKEPIVCEKKVLSDINKGQQFFTMTIEQVAACLRCNLTGGLSQSEAKSRLRVFGENQIKREKGVSIIRLFLGHLFSVLNFVLLAAATASIVAAVLEKSFDWIEGALVFIIMNSNTLIGFFQDYRSAKTMQSLMKMFAPQAEVSRDGERMAIPAKTLVPGDIVHLEDGDFVPADLRIIEAVNFYIDEAFLTGESDPVAKTVSPLKQEGAHALGDRTNMAYMSSVVTGGRGRGIVVRTGEETEIGSIAKKLRSSKKDKKKTELQKSMKKLGIALFISAIAFSFLVLAIQMLAVGTHALSDRSTWLYIVALCVAFIPEGLPAILALTLAIGMRTMAKKNAIVRKLGVLESLNWVTDICSDKTGTLTEGKMVATSIWCNGKHYSVSGMGIIPEGQVTERPNGAVVHPHNLDHKDTVSLLFQAAALCNMATLTKVGDEWQATSSPTEIALQVLAHKVGMGKPTMEYQYKFLGEHPFDSNWKRMSVVYGRISNTDEQNNIDPGFNAEDTIMYMKGSVEGLLGCCKYISENGFAIEITEEKKRKILKEVDRLASQGLRVIAIAFKDNFKFSTTDTRQKTDENSIFLGLVGIMDPPRPISKASVEKARQAGIDVYMLTGDHKKTAENIAKKVGIIRNDLFDTVMIGSQFEQQKLGGENLPKVIARCNPDTKIKMINELHSKGKYVIMTGDGVNDAPAIKMSDIGVAMGLNGSEVTKDSADIVLMDDNFGTIISALEEGRRIFSNINKIVLFLMTSNVAEVIVLVVGLCLSFAIPNTVVYPLTPMQILWLNVITDTPICMALGAEPVSSDAMKQPPKSRADGLFNLEMLIDMTVFGVVIGTFSLANFAITFFTYSNRDQFEIIYGKSVQTSLYVARATCFFTLTYGMLLHGFTCLHQRRSIMLHKFKKKWILLTIVVGALSLLVTVYVPWINIHVFKHYQLGWVQWIQVILAVAFFIIVSEIYKFSKSLIIQIYRTGQETSDLARRVSDAICSIDRKFGGTTEEIPEEFEFV